VRPISPLGNQCRQLALGLVRPALALFIRPSTGVLGGAAFFFVLL
jgi:hypothetical protein